MLSHTTKATDNESKRDEHDILPIKPIGFQEIKMNSNIDYTNWCETDGLDTLIFRVRYPICNMHHLTRVGVDSCRPAALARSKPEDTGLGMAPAVTIGRTPTQFEV